MIVIASPDAAEHVAAHGGRLYVWAERRGCCSARATYLEASTEPPQRPFRLAARDGFELWLDERLGREPEELHVELRGRRTKRPAAYWNGCAVVI